MAKKKENVFNWNWFRWKPVGHCVLTSSKSVIKDENPFHAVRQTGNEVSRKNKFKRKKKRKRKIRETQTGSERGQRKEAHKFKSTIKYSLFPFRISHLQYFGLFAPTKYARALVDSFIQSRIAQSNNNKWTTKWRNSIKVASRDIESNGNGAMPSATRQPIHLLSC